MYYMVYVLDPDVSRGLAVVDRMNTCSEQFGSRRYRFQFFSGAEEMQMDGRTYRFYQDTVLDQLQGRFARDLAGIDFHPALCLQTVLSSCDFMSGALEYEPSMDYAVKLYKAFGNRLPVYFMTDLLSFPYRSKQVFGRDLSDRYFSRELFLSEDHRQSFLIFNKFDAFLQRWGQQKCTK